MSSDANKLSIDFAHTSKSILSLYAGDIPVTFDEMIKCNQYQM